MFEDLQVLVPSLLSWCEYTISYFPDSSTCDFFFCKNSSFFFPSKKEVSHPTDEGCCTEPSCCDNEKYPYRLHSCHNPHYILWNFPLVVSCSCNIGWTIKSIKCSNSYSLSPLLSETDLYTQTLFTVRTENLPELHLVFTYWSTAAEIRSKSIGGSWKCSASAFFFRGLPPVPILIIY